MLKQYASEYRQWQISDIFVQPILLVHDTLHIALIGYDTSCIAHILQDTSHIAPICMMYSILKISSRAQKTDVVPPVCAISGIIVCKQMMSNIVTCTVKHNL